LVAPELDTDADAYDAPADKRPSARRAPCSAPPYNTPAAIEAYAPQVTLAREWIVSEVDLEWISLGCYILGTGGGGTPYPHFVRVREMMRKGSIIRIMSVDDLADDAVIACGGGKGSPTVSIEKLAGDEMMESQNFLYELVGRKPDAVIALEIGGGNGLQGMLFSQVVLRSKIIMRLPRPTPRRIRTHGYPCC
jgi:tryptophan synthase beta subunit